MGTLTGTDVVYTADDEDDYTATLAHAYDAPEVDNVRADPDTLTITFNLISPPE